MKNKRMQKGQTLVIVLLLLVVIGILVPALVFWTRQESFWAVQEQKSSIAFNLADSGIERGMWKLKSSTTTWRSASKGIVVPGFNFDVKYDDMPGGYYRIKYSSGPARNQVTIIAEGMDIDAKEIRSIQAIYVNQSIPGAVISRGVITWANAFEAHWGPIMSHNNINITDAAAGQQYFPRKYSRQTVTCNSKGYERDTNGLDPPNTDGVEWWSGYNVPDLPVLDFESMRSSASITKTLNIYGCTKTGAAWDARKSCPTGGAHTSHFGNPWNHTLARKNYVWYWDNDVILAGSTGTDGCGIFGTVIARGNLTLDVGDNYSYVGPVPALAWQEYAKITKSAGDSGATDEYPADAGLQKTNPTFKFGNQTWANTPAGKSAYPPTYNTDVGVRGFIYVGGNLTINGPLDINGAVWVEGTVNKAVGSDRCIVFFDDTLEIPSLNVVLVKQSWQEIGPDPQAWP
ncbi:MAG: hypothetical protein ABII64_09855 [Elusimicrobiota bacterium]